MKLCEIYYDPHDEWHDQGNRDTTSLNRDSRDAVSKKRENPNHRYLGAGSYAYVGTDDIENFGDVHRIADKIENGSQFLSLLHMSRFNNPFMPKVRKVEHNGTSQITIVERLVPFNTPSIVNSIPLMKSLWNKYFVEEWNEAEGHSMLIFPAIIDDMLYRRDMGRASKLTVKDPQLKEALQYILETSEDIDGSVTDIGISNVMWRMTPYYPQVVFTDPIA